MYVWVVLTTFLAMIAAYVLPIRPDAEKLVVVPVAQAKMMQMVVKQKAAMQYMKEGSWPYYGTESGREVSFNSGVPDLTDYLPKGFADNDEFITALYCLNDEMTALKTGDQACRRSSSDKVKRVLITYGAIPEKWRRYEENGSEYRIRPSSDMMQALRGHFGMLEMVGYVIVEDGKYYIVNYVGTKFEIPDIVANNEGMAHYGLNECIDEYGTCLAFLNMR